MMKTALSLALLFCLSPSSLRAQTEPAEPAGGAAEVPTPVPAIGEIQKIAGPEGAVPLAPPETPAGPTSAESPPRIFVGLSGEYLAGYSQYEISGVDEGVSFKSRLEWPLNTVLIGPDASIFFSGNRFVATLSYRANVTDQPGELEDYDWFYGEKTLLGKVETELTAQVFDFRFLWNTVRKDNFTLGLGAGYNYQYFFWEADGDLKMTHYNWYFYPPYSPGTYDFGEAKWITYKLHYHLPYLIVDGNLRFSDLYSLRAFGRLLLVIATDEDDHVQRSKLSESTYTGIGLNLGVENRFDLGGGVGGSLYLHYAYLTAEGDQDQEWYDGSGFKYDGIDAKAESQQLTVGGRVGFEF